MYDPLVHSNIPTGQSYPATYWADSVPSPRVNVLKQDISVETAIIGGGYAGLSCAFHLAKNYQQQSVVLEANNVGWGCSGRNAGFVLPLSGRLGYQALVKRFGMETSQKLHNEFLAGIHLVEDLVDQSGADVERQVQGYLKIAHRPKYFEQLKVNASYMEKHFGYQVTPLSKAELVEHYVDHKDAYGALRYHQGYGIHPLKLVLAYHQLALAKGVKVYGNSPVTQWQKVGNKHVLTTPQGTVSADNLVICTNGYTPKGLHPAVEKRTLPVLTSVIVTRPLTASEIQNARFFTNQVMMDTRQLKYYYRKLPDNRILFGGRGAITGQQAESEKYYQRLLTALKHSFPALHDVTIDYRYSGWISVSLDEIPHIYQADDRVFYSAGYCGAGLSFSTLAGLRLAEKIAGDDKAHQIPTLQSPLPLFPLAPFRRVGQSMFYQLGRIQDNFF